MGDVFFTRKYSVDSFTPITATGGTVTNIGDYRYHAFTSVGTSTFNITNTGSDKMVEYLIVGGGGGGGSFGGGGGAGGLLTNVTSTPLSINAQNYTITIGDGGLGSTTVDNQTSSQTNANGKNGQNSFAFGLTSIGGGGGGTRWNASSSPAYLGRPGNNGGSGGGGANSDSGAGGAGGSGTSGQGNNGGAGGSGTGGTPNYTHGGGGGAGGIGETGKTVGTRGADGGIGLNLSAYFPNWGTNSSNTTTGTRGWFAGGGGGGIYTTGTRAGLGKSGGGNGGDEGRVINGTPGLLNTGGGGGGSRYSTGPVGGKGGSGIVLIRYPLVQVN